MAADRNVWVFSVLIGLSGVGCHGAPPATVSGGSGHASAGRGAGSRDAPQDEPRDEPHEGPDVVDPADPSLEIDPQVCEVDSDCMVGTPRDCCTGFCPEHAVAWSHNAWAEYQQVCAVVECTAPESLACLPESELGPAPTARCVHERCVLR